MDNGVKYNVKSSWAVSAFTASLTRSSNCQFMSCTFYLFISCMLHQFLHCCYSEKLRSLTVSVSWLKCQESQPRRFLKIHWRSGSTSSCSVSASFDSWHDWKKPPGAQCSTLPGVSSGHTVVIQGQIYKIKGQKIAQDLFFWHQLTKTGNVTFKTDLNTHKKV